MIQFIFLIVIITFIQGCSNQYKKDILKEELRTELNISNNSIFKKPAIEIIKVNAENFNISKSTIPDNEQIKRVKIMGAQLNDVITLITEATNQNIIFQLQSDTLDDTQSNNSLNNTNNSTI